MMLSRAMTLALETRGGGVAAAPTYAADVFYTDFGATTVAVPDDTSLSGFAATNGQTFTVQLKSGGTDTTPPLSGVRINTNKVIGQKGGGTGYPNQYARRQCTTLVTGVRTTKARIFNDLVICLHNGFDGSNLKNQMNINVNGEGSFGAIAFRCAVAGVTLSNGVVGPNITRHKGDVVAVKEEIVAGTRYATPYLNGTQVGAADSMSGSRYTGLPLTEAHGWEAAASSLTSTSKTVDDFWIYDDTNAFIDVIFTRHTQQRQTNGDLLIKLQGTYGGATCATPNVSYMQEAAGVDSVVVGYSAIPMTSFVAAAGAWTGTFTILSADVKAPGFLKIERTDIVGSVSQPAYTPRFYRAIQAIGYGQSLWENPSLATASGATAVPATDGSEESCLNNTANWPSTPYLNRNAVPVSGSCNAILTIGMKSWASTAGACLINVAYGGVNTLERQPGSVYFDNAKDGLRRAGNDAEFGHDWSGQFDTAFSAATFKSQMTTIWYGTGSFSDLCGRTLPVIVNPTTAQWGAATDSAVETIRRAGGFELPLENSNFKYGFFMLDAEHDSGADKSYHWASDWSGEQARRATLHYPWALGGVSAGYAAGRDMRGPEVVSASVISDTVIRVVWELRGFDTLAHINTADTGNYHGGCRFAANTTGNFTTRIWPTLVTMAGAAVGTTWSADFTFSGTTFTSTGASIGAMWGANPLNPLNNATVTTNWWNLGLYPSMIYGTKSGETPVVGVGVAQRPLWSNNGAGGSAKDYVTAV